MPVIRSPCLFLLPTWYGSAEKTSGGKGLVPLGAVGLVERQYHDTWSEVRQLLALLRFYLARLRLWSLASLLTTARR